MQRRTFLKGVGALFAAGVAIPATRYWPEDGWSNPCVPADLPAELLAHPRIQAALQGVRFADVWDMHAHLTGLGDSASGIWVNPRMHSLYHPVEYAQKAFYMNAACASTDEAFVRRVAQLAAAFPAGFKLVLFAFDRFHGIDGKPVDEFSQFYVPNRYAAEVAALHPGHFEWAASVHPYRPDWREELDYCLRHGARAVKWLPPSMGIDPADARCDAFYDVLAAANLPLITHAGEEQAAKGADLQDYGNPLRLRRALDRGVRVVVAHCASLGAGIDLDKGANGAAVDNFALFGRLMQQERYAATLFGDISAVTQINRMGYLQTLLERSEWHPRLLNGSDYPLPGIMPLFSARRIAAAGLLPEDALPALAELRRHNALMFDFVLKRTLAWQGKSLPASIFESRPFFERKPA
jgi:mannonate dehydratase